MSTRKMIAMNAAQKAAVIEIDREIRVCESELKQALEAAARLSLIQEDLAALRRTKARISKERERANSSVVSDSHSNVREIMQGIQAQVKERETTYNDIAERLMRQAGKALSVAEIMAGLAVHGKHPRKDVAIGGLYRTLRKGQKRFKKFGSKWGLYEWPDVPE